VSTYDIYLNNGFIVGTVIVLARWIKRRFK